MGELFLFIIIGSVISTALCIHLRRLMNPLIFLTFDDPPKLLPDLTRFQDQLFRAVLEAARIPERYFKDKPPVETGYLRQSMCSFDVKDEPD